MTAATRNHRDEKVFYPDNRRSRAACQAAQADADRIGVFTLTSTTSLTEGDVVVDSDGPESPTRVVAVVAGVPENFKVDGGWRTEVPVVGGTAVFGGDADTVTVVDRAAVGAGAEDS